MGTVPRFDRIVLGASYLFELAKGAFILVALGILTHTFVATIFVIDGASMEPTLHSRQAIEVSRLTYLTGKPVRGDVVVLRFPGDPFRKKYIKRIVGLPGETVAIHNDKVYVNGQPLAEPYLAPNTKTQSAKHQEFTLQEEEYVALGDNRALSNDSRIWGVLPLQLIVGKASLVLWPIEAAGRIK